MNIIDKLRAIVASGEAGAVYPGEAEDLLAIIRKPVAQPNYAALGLGSREEAEERN